MAKKKNQNSKTPRESNIGSSSLLPARIHGERPDMAFPIKREPIENNDEEMETEFPINNPEIAELFQGIADARNSAVLGEGAESNHSAISTCTEPMDNGEENICDSHLPSPTGSHMGPTSFAEVLVKQEVRMPEVLSDQAECFSPHNAISVTAAGHSDVYETVSNNHIENYSGNNVATLTVNDLVKKEPVENNENSQDINIQNVINTPVNIKVEPVEKPENDPEENTTELENKNNEKLPVKRKPNLELFESKLERLRKRLKKEPCEDDVNENETRNFPCELNETQQEITPVVHSSKINDISDLEKNEMTGDNEGAEDALREEIIDHEIAVLPVPKIEKNIETITLSDDDDPQISEEHDIEMMSIDDENISTSLPTNSNVTDIHCNAPVIPSAQSLLQPSTSASPKKLTKERNFSTDILSYFSVTSELDRYDCQVCLDSLQKKKVNNPLNNFFPIMKREAKSKDEIKKGDILFNKIITEAHSDTKRTPISQNDNSILQNLPLQSTTERFPSLFSPSLLPVETCSASVSQPNVNLPGLPTSQSTMFSSTSSNFEVKSSPNSSLATALTQIQIQDLISILPNLKFPDISKKGATSDQHHIGDNNQVREATVISPQAPLDNAVSQTVTPLSNRTSQMPSYSAATTFAPAASSYSVPTSYLPTILSTPAAPKCSQETHDPRHAIKKPMLSANIENNVQNRNTAIVQPRVSFQPVTTLPNNNFQNLPGQSTSINLSRSPASLLPLGTRDPRTAVNREFLPRKTTKYYPLYRNIGQEEITSYFDDLILEWNPDWVRVQQKTNLLPPICDSYKHVVYFYSNEMDYYNTYVPLHLLHIWYNIFECCVKEHYTVVSNCKVQSVERIQDGYSCKITFSAELQNTEVLPKNDDIVWIKHNNEEAFLRVEDVKKKPLTSGRGVKLKMILRTLHNFKFDIHDVVSFLILYNTRAAFLQTEALTTLDNSIKDLILKPTELINRFETVQLNFNKKIKEQRDDVLNVVRKPEIRVVVVETYYTYDNVLMLTQITYNILKIFNRLFREKDNLSSKNQPTTQKDSKVLIVLKNDQLLEKLYKRLSQYEPILAVRTKQINLTPDLIKHTIEDRLEKNAAENRDSKECISRILNEHHIFLTTVSAFGSTEKNLLSKMRDLICIIDDAHLCTEVETALPLTLKLNKLLLIGNKDRSPELPPALLHYKYNVTLFTRLMKAKMRH